MEEMINNNFKYHQNQMVKNQLIMVFNNNIRKI